MLTEQINFGKHYPLNYHYNFLKTKLKLGHVIDDSIKCAQDTNMYIISSFTTALYSTLGKIPPLLNVKSQSAILQSKQ